MKVKRVDKLVAGERIAYRGEVWRVVRARPGHTARYRDLRLRPPADMVPPEDVVWPVDTMVEVVDE